jgi:hypothetical protein
MNKRKAHRMETSVGFKIYTLLGILETKHNLNWADGLHRQVLMAVIDAHYTDKKLSNVDLVEMQFTSRSSTYRKIAELKDLGFLAEEWHEGVCYLILGNSTLELMKDAHTNLASILKADS